ncbi:hypothetical protein [Gracilibacillus alcaliphilus]|uniref:hypothetical protein n=1 Tax=Gracilibacillus alcaliphilus TaxID=1401441 RepID=UPI00195DF606|nr:hypothetical protein [Gracilibacillus alcaliphilus]
MTKLKLKNALSYRGIVSATAKNPFVTVKDEKLAKAAVETGYFEIVEQEQQHDQEAPNDNNQNKAYTKSYLKKLNKDQQEKIIAELSGDPSDTGNEEERIALILELQNDTMLQLQGD